MKSLGWVSGAAVPLPNGGWGEFFEDPVFDEAHRVTDATKSQTSCLSVGAGRVP
jgi:hypothetical protein